MKKLFDQWVTDAEAFELQSQYSVNNQEKYDFVERQGDFYITLLSRMYDILQGVNNLNYCEFKEELHSIAQGMLVYSEKASEGHFNFIDKNSNQLYVATIYFLTGYEAVASYILKSYNPSQFNTESAKFLFCIVSGNLDFTPKNLEDRENLYSDLQSVKNFLLNGDQSIKIVSKKLEKKLSDFTFDSLDDFFDTTILVHAFRKLLFSNIRKTLYTADQSTNWDRYIQYSVGRHILSLLPSQIDAIKKGLLKFNRAFSLKMPTSGGKSFITELIIYQELQRNNKAKILYLAPLRSLNRELKDSFKKTSKKLGFTFRAIYGGNTFAANELFWETASVLISTPETFATIEDSIDEELSSFSLVICDEGQLLDSFERGISYELLLSRLKKNKAARFLFLSAIIPNIDDVNTWLGGGREEVGDSSYRPCPIKLAVVKLQPDKGLALSVKDAQYSDEKFQIRDFIPANDIFKITTKNNQLTIKRKASLLAIRSLAAGQTLIYTTSKNGPKGCVAIGNEILKVLKTGPLENLKIQSPVEFTGRIEEYLKYQLGEHHSLVQFIKNGFAYHHGSLPQNIREIIERGFASGAISLLISTSTLAEGVNLPIHTLIPYDLQRYDGNRAVPLSVSELKNILGRAGRAGKQQFGVILVPDENERKSSYKAIVEALQGSGVGEIKGTLYDVVKALQGLTSVKSDSEINTLLENCRFDAAIDTMIVRSAQFQLLDDVDIDQIVKESLAYHVGTTETRSSLRRVFRIRRDEIKKHLLFPKYQILRNTTLTVKDILKIDEIFDKTGVVLLEIENPKSPKWINWVVTCVTSMPSYKYSQIKFNEGEKRNITFSELKTVLICWMEGKQYYEIADRMACGVDEIFTVISNIQNEFSALAASIFRYLEDICLVDMGDFETWLVFVRYGLDSQEKLKLMKCGITDRVMVNAFLNITSNLPINYRDRLSVRLSIYSNRQQIMTRLREMKIPEISKEQVYDLIGVSQHYLQRVFPLYLDYYD